MDLEGQFTYVSPSVERQMGYTRQEALQRGFQDMLTPGSLSMASGKLKAAVAELALHPHPHPLPEGEGTP